MLGFVSNCRKRVTSLAKLRLKQHHRVSDSGYEIAPVARVRREPDPKRTPNGTSATTGSGTSVD
jgi:hypothetical protein